jgi:quinol monooxygenase YgiN
MVIIQGSVRVGEADMAKFRAAAATMIAATRAEAGCILYAFAEDLVEAGLVRISERWRDQAAVDAHLKTPHMAAFGAVLAGLSLKELKVVAYDAANERVLVER